MDLKKYIRNYGIMALGSLIIGIGVAPVVIANLGADSMTTFEQGITMVMNISLPIAQLIANGIFIVLLFVLSRKNVGIDTVLSPMFISLGCTIGLKLIEFVPEFNRYVEFFIGLVIIGLGIGIGSMTETGSNPYDGFILVIAEKIRKEYSIMRVVMDALLLIVGILMHGTFGIGTIIAIACQGFIANFFVKLFRSMKH